MFKIHKWALLCVRSHSCCRKSWTNNNDPLAARRGPIAWFCRRRSDSIKLSGNCVSAACLQRRPLMANRCEATMCEYKTPSQVSHWNTLRFGRDSSVECHIVGAHILGAHIVGAYWNTFTSLAHVVRGPYLHMATWNKLSSHDTA